MTNPEQSEANASKDETELSPEAKAVLGRARRSFGVSVGILLLGFMAIAFALVYRVMRDAPPPVLAQSVALPAGAEVISALTSDGAVQVTYRLAGEIKLAVFNAESGALDRTVSIGTE